MRLFIKQFFMAIPLGLGIVLAIFSVVNAMEISSGGDHTAFWALSCGVTGIPLLFTSIMALVGQAKNNFWMNV